MKIHSFVFVLLQAVCGLAYDVGVGIGDITGPAVEVGFMGYAKDSQKGEGIHMRQWARAFVIADNNKRFVFVSIDAGMGSDLLNKRVITKLEATLGEGVYTYENLCISGTHTHSTPAGFLQYVIFQTSSLGFVEEYMDSLVQGVTRAILQAHWSAKPGRISYASGNLFESNINRSPTSYLRNPQEELNEYKEAGDTDKNMFLLRFDADDGTPLGVLNWFAVHGTSMNNTNTLISGDNKGYASYLFEKAMNGKHSSPGNGSFVAAFASTNLGDVSPNTKGAFCMDTGLPCDRLTSTCNGKEELCVGVGPGKNGDMWESTSIIGKKQFNHAMDLFQGEMTEITGPLDYRHSFVNFDGLRVELANGSYTQTCTAAYGYSFAAGTTDGCGMFNFTQGTNSSNPFWAFASGILSKPTEEQIECHKPKPILLNLAKLTFPYDWEAPTLPLQLFRIGDVVIAPVPLELTTMAGRRFRKGLKKVFMSSDLMGGREPLVAIAGLANSYAHYTTTFEEYQAQRYEAGSTVYGPHQLSGLIQEISRIASDMVSGHESDTGPSPPDLSSKQASFLTGVVFDSTPAGISFGQCLTETSALYHAGDVIQLKFQSGNPRNNRRLQGTFLTVDHQVNGGSWETIATDADWETKFRWKETGVAESNVFIEWTIPVDVEHGLYRICHFGDQKSFPGIEVKAYQGCSNSFRVDGQLGADVLI